MFFDISPKYWLNSSELRLYTDASGAVGYSADFGSLWLKEEWNNGWHNQSIAVLELFHIVLAVDVWSKYISNKCILFNTDNESMVHVIIKQTA